MYLRPIRSGGAPHGRGIRLRADQETPVNTLCRLNTSRSILDRPVDRHRSTLGTGRQGGKCHDAHSLHSRQRPHQAWWNGGQKVRGFVLGQRATPSSRQTVERPRPQDTWLLANGHCHRPSRVRHPGRCHHLRFDAHLGFDDCSHPPCNACGTRNLIAAVRHSMSASSLNGLHRKPTAPLASARVRCFSFG